MNKNKNIKKLKKVIRLLMNKNKSKKYKNIKKNIKKNIEKI